MTGKPNLVQLVMFSHKKRVLSVRNTKYTGNAETQFSQKAPIQIAQDQLHFSHINMFRIKQFTPPKNILF